MYEMKVQCTRDPSMENIYMLRKNALIQITCTKYLIQLVKKINNPILQIDSSVNINFIHSLFRRNEQRCAHLFIIFDVFVGFMNVITLVFSPFNCAVSLAQSMWNLNCSTCLFHRESSGALRVINIFCLVFSFC